MIKKIKFCGLTRPEDVKKATHLGVDAIGLVFYPPSPRAVQIDEAIELARLIPAFISVVALVVNISDDKLCQIAKQVPFDVIQFHGDESADECYRQAALINKRWIKALRINAKTDTAETVANRIDEFAQKGAAAILLDAYHQDKFGGTGERFDWSIIPKTASLPIILAGGLTCENISDTKDLPIYAVDVSGGIEADKGIKDFDKMQRFVTSIRTAL